MICSTAEVEALVLRAARGAGLPVGAAQEIAGLIETLSAVDIPLWDDLIATLTPPFEPVTTHDDGGALVFQTARVARDGPGAIDAALCGREVHLEALDAPGIMALLVQAAERDFEIGLSDSAKVDGGPVVLRLGPFDPNDASGNRRPLRMDVPDTVFTRLKELAAKTYVPASEASRRSGAGAGLTDND